MQAVGAACAVSVAGDEFNHAGIAAGGCVFDFEAQPFGGREIDLAGGGFAVPGGEQVVGQVQGVGAIARAHELLGAAGMALRRGLQTLVPDGAALAVGLWCGLAAAAGAGGAAGQGRFGAVFLFEEGAMDGFAHEG